MQLPQTSFSPYSPRSPEIAGNPEPINNVENHLRTALAHLAVAEALAPIDGVGEDPTINALAQQIQKLSFSMLINADVLPEQPRPNRPSIVAEVESTAVTESSIFELETTAMHSGNGWGNVARELDSHVGQSTDEVTEAVEHEVETVAQEAVVPESFEAAKEPQVLAEETIAPPPVSPPEIIDKSILRLPVPGLRPENLGPPRRIISIISDDTLVYNGNIVALSPMQVKAVTEFIKNPGVYMDSSQYIKGMSNFPVHFQILRKKLEEVGLSEVFIKRGENRWTNWKLSEDVAFVDARLETLDLVAQHVSVTQLSSEAETSNIINAFRQPNTEKTDPVKKNG